MRKTILLTLVLLAAVPAAIAAPPRLVSAYPADGAVDVPVDVGLLRFMFGEDMQPDTWTLWASARGEFPPVDESVTAPWLDARSFEIKLGALSPDTLYAVQLNCEAKGRQGFRSAAGEPLPDTTIVFRTGAGGTPPPNVPPADPPAGGARDWTILAVLDGDNDLERAIVGDLNDLEAGFPERGVEVIALLDRARGFYDGDGDFTDARVYRVRKGTDPERVESELLESPGELNLGDPDVVAKFIAEALEKYPAKRYALFLNDHGSGWSGLVYDHDAPGAEKGADNLTLPELAAALGKGLEAANVPAFDIVCLDLCLMAQLEVALVLRPYASFLVASEATVPGLGLTHEAVLSAFAAGAPTAEVAKGIVQGFGAFYDARQEKTATLSAIDLEKLGPVTAAVDALARKVEPLVAANWAGISRALFYAESYAGRTDFRAGEKAIASVDLLDAAKRIALKVPAAQPEYRGLEAAVGGAVIASHASATRRLSRGLSVYAPPRGDILSPRYGPEAGGSPAWLSLLAAVHRAQAGQLAPPVVSAVRLVGPDGQETKSVTSLGGTHMEFTVEGGNILWTTATQVKRLDKPDGFAVMFRVLVTDPRFDERRRETAAEFADAVMPEYVDGANALRREVGGLGFRVILGGEVFEATVDLTDPNDLTHVRVPAIVDEPGMGRVLADLFFNTNWSTVDSVVAFVETPSGDRIARRIAPSPGAEVTFLYEVLVDKGMALAATGSAKWGSGPELIPVFQEPGSYAMAIEAESIGGVSGSKIFRYEEEANTGFRNLFDRAGKWAPKELAGTWDLKNGVLAPGAAQLTWQPTGVRLAFREEPDSVNVLSYEIRQPGGTQGGLALVDLRSAPCIIYFAKDAVGEWARSDFHIVFKYLEGGQTGFILKDVLLGGVYLLTRSGDAPPPAGGSVIGQWSSPDGVRMRFTADRYEVRSGGALYDQGTFTIADGEIRVKSDSGGTLALRFALAGDTLTLTWPDGSVRTFRRER